MILLVLVALLAPPAAPAFGVRAVLDTPRGIRLHCSAPACPTDFRHLRLTHRIFDGGGLAEHNLAISAAHAVTARQMELELAAPVSPLGVLVLSTATESVPVERQAGVLGDWADRPGSQWAGKDFWANRLQDWQVRGGKLECLAAGPNQELRTAHVLTREVLPSKGEMILSVRTGLLDPGSGEGFSGFLIGAGGGKLEYRAAALVHHLSGEGGGLLAVLDMDGRPQFRDNSSETHKNTYPALDHAPVEGLTRERGLWEDVQLDLEAVPADGGRYELRLAAWDASSGEFLGGAIMRHVEGSLLLGSIALVSSPLGAQPGPRFWFRDLRMAGAKLRARPERAFGPVAAALHTVSGGVMKMTAQFLPVEGGRAVMEFRPSGDTQWKAVETEILRPGYTAHFRVHDWDAAKDAHYRILCLGAVAYEGVIRREPLDQDEITVAAFTGQQVIARPADDSWGATGYAAPGGRWTRDNVWFPHTEIVAGVASRKPDILVFTGDQIYESGNPTGRDHQGRFPELDYLYRWYLWCWSLGQMAGSTPAVLLLDDHDVYHGNLWGMGVRRNVNGDDQYGGFLYDAEFIRMVERIQTWHLPDARDPGPYRNGIGAYFTALDYGGISFAIIEDRKFKSPPVALRNLRPGVLKDGKIIDPSFDIAVATPAELDLLGAEQTRFLEEWAHDWKGARMKVLLSQTVFASVQTDADRNMVADLDSNGWPMGARDRAIDILRRGHVFGIAGDTHLSFVVRHGVEEHGERIYQFCVPAVANKYRRWFDPATPGRNRKQDSPSYTGEHEDAFGNKITILAVGNSRVTPEQIMREGGAAGDPRPPVGAGARDQFFSRPEVSYAGVVDYHTVLGRDINADGYGIVRVNKQEQTIRIENWPWNARPGQDDSGQYGGWPITLRLEELDGRVPTAYLPDLRVHGMSQAVVQVSDEQSGEIIYTTRMRGDLYRPRVFRPGVYRVTVGEPGTEAMLVLNGLESKPAPEGEVIQVRLAPAGR